MLYGYFGGRVTKVRDARIAPHDIGILRGYGVFDFFRTHNGQPFLLHEHYVRLKKSARALGLKVSISEVALYDAVIELLKKNKIKDGNFRMVLTGGPSENGIESTGENFYILVYNVDSLPTEWYTNGARLIVENHMRAYPEFKTNNYITAVRLQKKKKAAKAVEILYTHNGHIYECSTSNFFIVKNGTIITAKDDILKGVTRNAVIAIARKHGYVVEERPVCIDEITTADEAFITTTTKNVLPITVIDSKKIGNGKVGEVSKQLNKLFLDFADKNTK